MCGLPLHALVDLTDRVCYILRIFLDNTGCIRHFTGRCRQLIRRLTDLLHQLLVVCDHVICRSSKSAELVASLHGHGRCQITFRHNLKASGNTLHILADSACHCSSDQKCNDTGDQNSRYRDLLNGLCLSGNDLQRHQRTHRCPGILTLAVEKQIICSVVLHLSYAVRLTRLQIKILVCKNRLSLDRSSLFVSRIALHCKLSAACRHESHNASVSQIQSLHELCDCLRLDVDYDNRLTVLRGCLIYHNVSGRVDAQILIQRIVMVIPLFQLAINRHLIHVLLVNALLRLVLRRDHLQITGRNNIDVADIGVANLGSKNSCLHLVNQRPLGRRIIVVNPHKILSKIRIHHVF